MSGKIVLERAAEKCRKSAADEWEVYALENSSLTAEARDGEIDALEASHGAGLSVRVIVNGRMGFSYSADSGDDALGAMVESAVFGARSADPDEGAAFAQPQDVPSLDLWDKGLADARHEDKLSRPVALEEKARGHDRRIRAVRKASYGESSRVERLLNSNGVELEARANGCYASVMAVAEENGQSQMGWDFAYSPNWDGLDVEAVGVNAAKDAVDMLGAKTLPTRETPVILRNTAAAQLLAVLGNSFLGESALKGKSMLASKMGQTVFSELLDIYDNGLLEGGPATFPFDGEGAPSETTALVKKGRLEAFLYDIKWAARAGKKSTGNSSRREYTAPPGMGLTNLRIPAGQRPLDDIIAEMGDGLLVKELMGVHTANPITGDFSLGASGTWLEKGEPAHPVQGVTIAGNILELFARVDAVDDDLKFIDNLGCPSLRVSCLTISGE